MLTDSSRRSEFPALDDKAYLNTAAESIPPLCVGEAINDYWMDKQQGMRGRDAHFSTVEACREISAEFLGLAAHEVSFCSCTSEAYNLLGSALDLGPEDQVVVSDLDFPAGVTPWLRAARPPQVRLWKSENGELQRLNLVGLLNEKTKLVQVSLVSFLNGHRLDWTPFQEAVRRLARNAIIAVDVTQALGRITIDCPGADVFISSTHKWALGIHGGCIVGIPAHHAETLTTHAGGWYHLENAFDADRFQHAQPLAGARSFSVGMPNFISLYALNASLRYLRDVGVTAIQHHADPLVKCLHAELSALGLEPMCPWRDDRPSGIISFQHERAATIHAALEEAHVHVMHHAGRIRLAVHGYNTESDIQRALDVIQATART